jgi:hypothetical protein
VNSKTIVKAFKVVVEKLTTKSREMVKKEAMLAVQAGQDQDSLLQEINLLKDLFLLSEK